MNFASTEITLIGSYSLRYDGTTIGVKSNNSTYRQDRAAFSAWVCELLSGEPLLAVELADRNLGRWIRSRKLVGAQLTQGDIRTFIENSKIDVLDFVQALRENDVKVAEGLVPEPGILFERLEEGIAPYYLRFAQNLISQVIEDFLSHQGSTLSPWVQSLREGVPTGGSTKAQKVLFRTEKALKLPRADMFSKLRKLWGELFRDYDFALIRLSLGRAEPVIGDSFEFSVAHAILSFSLGDIEVAKAWTDKANDLYLGPTASAAQKLAYVHINAKWKLTDYEHESSPVLQRHLLDEVRRLNAPELSDLPMTLLRANTAIRIRACICEFGRVSTTVDRNRLPGVALVDPMPDLKKYVETSDSNVIRGSSRPRGILSVFYWHALQAAFPEELGTPGPIEMASAYEVVTANSWDFAPVSTYAHSLLLLGLEKEAKAVLNKFPNCTDWTRRDVHAAHYALLGLIVGVSKDRRSLCRRILRDVLNQPVRQRLDMNWGNIFSNGKRGFHHELAIALRWGKTLDELDPEFNGKL